MSARLVAMDPRTKILSERALSKFHRPLDESNVVQGAPTFAAGRAALAAIAPGGESSPSPQESAALNWRQYHATHFDDQTFSFGAQKALDEYQQRLNDGSIRPGALFYVGILAAADGETAVWVHHVFAQAGCANILRLYLSDVLPAQASMPGSFASALGLHSVALDAFNRPLLGPGLPGGWPMGGCDFTWFRMAFYEASTSLLAVSAVADRRVTHPGGLVLLQWPASQARTAAPAVSHAIHSRALTHVKVEATEITAAHGMMGSAVTVTARSSGVPVASKPDGVPFVAALLHGRPSLRDTLVLQADAETARAIWACAEAIERAVVEGITEVEPLVDVSRALDAHHFLAVVLRGNLACRAEDVVLPGVRPRARYLQRLTGVPLVFVLLAMCLQGPMAGLLSAAAEHTRESRPGKRDIVGCLRRNGFTQDVRSPETPDGELLYAIEEKIGHGHINRVKVQLEEGETGIVVARPHLVLETAAAAVDARTPVDGLRRDAAVGLEAAATILFLPWLGYLRNVWMAGEPPGDATKSGACAQQQQQQRAMCDFYFSVLGA